MKGLVARLIGYLFLGSFCIAGPLLLAIALGSAAQRAVLILSGTHVEGTVIAKRPTGSSRVTYAPVIQFTADDGRAYVVTSDVYGRESAFSYGEQVRVIYRRSNPEAARIDVFAQLWTFPLVFGVVGAAFSVIPVLVLLTWLRRRRRGSEPDSMEPARVATASPGFRWAVGFLLTASGLAMLALGVVGSSSLNGSRALAIGLGIFLAACGVLLGQWVSTCGRLYHALGGAAITSLAVVFGWVANAGGFSGGISVGGVGVTPDSSVAPARIAFGIGSIVFGLSSISAWKQVFRPGG